MMFLPGSLCFFAFSAEALRDLLHRFGVRGDLLFLQSANFVAMAAVLYVLAFRPVLRVMEERRQKIAEGLAQAGAAQEQLQAAEKLRQQIRRGAEQEARRIVAEAREQAQAHRQEQEQRAQERVEQLIAGAREVIAQERQKALDEVQRQMGALVVDLAERVLEGQLGAAERERYRRRTQACLEPKAAG